MTAPRPADHPGHAHGTRQDRAGGPRPPAAAADHPRAAARSWGTSGGPGDVLKGEGGTLLENSPLCPPTSKVINPDSHASSGDGGCKDHGRVFSDSTVLGLEAYAVDLDDAAADLEQLDRTELEGLDDHGDLDPAPEVLVADPDDDDPDELRAELEATFEAARENAEAAELADLEIARQEYEEDLGRRGAYGAARARRMAHGIATLVRLGYRLAAKGDTEAGDALNRAAESLAKVRNAWSSCGKSYIHGTCSGKGAHEAAKKIRCRRLGCGCLKSSPRSFLRGKALDHRYVRAQKRLMWAEVWAYVVVTVPPEIRDRFRSKEGLKLLNWITVEVAKVYQPRAVGWLSCVHEFGDKSAKYHPHGNALGPLPTNTRYWIQKPDPDKGIAGDPRWRAARARAAELLGVDVSRVNVNYRFVKDGHDAKGRWCRRRRHRLRYVLRDTTMGELRDRDGRPRPFHHVLGMTTDDLVLVFHDLKGFHRVRWHGLLSPSKWKQIRDTPMVTRGLEREAATDPRAAARLALVEGLDKGGCPACAAPMTWARVRAELGPSERIDRETGELIAKSYVDQGADFYVCNRTWADMQRAAGRSPPREGGPPGGVT